LLSRLISFKSMNQASLAVNWFIILDAVAVAIIMPDSFSVQILFCVTGGKEA